MNVTATLAKSDKQIAVDTWRCSNCSGETYDASKFEVPTFCCRCGLRFEAVDYRDTEVRVEAAINSNHRETRG